MSVEEQYQDCLAYIYDKLPMFTRLGAAAYKPDLKNIEALCAMIGNPQHGFKSIHIAGTNGKGSCSHVLASILQCQGYRTGLYTSPHIFDFRERIKINGIPIAKEWVVKFLSSLREAIEEIKPSFFEITVAMAFAYFAEEQVDIAIIEVGLGGLLDSTNIITPMVSVITNISYDHQNLLGQTLPEIAEQKAGIIKTGVPVVIGETQPELERLFLTKSIMMHSAIYFADQHVYITDHEYLNGKTKIRCVDLSSSTVGTYMLGLEGDYQLKNFKTVWVTCKVLSSRYPEFVISQQAMEEGFRGVKSKTGFFGRYEVVHEQPHIVFDVSHNEAGIRELFQYVQQLSFERLHVITGFVQDKDVSSILCLFPKEAQYYFTQAAIPRAMPVDQLREIAQRHQLIGSTFLEPGMALQEAHSNSSLKDMILVTGSFFLLEGMMDRLQEIVK
jgi:dihydrofolate synthase/folylpolyglutamate synthase